MSWLKKLFTITKNSVNEKGEKAVDSLLDVRREGNAIVVNIENQAKDITKRIEDAQKLVVIAKEKSRHIAPKMDQFKAIAEKAVDAGNDVDALDALTRMEALELELEGHKLTIEDLSPLIEEQLEQVRHMNIEAGKLRNEIARLDIQDRSYKAKMALLGGDVKGNAFNMDDLRNRVLEAKAAVEAKSFVSTKVNGTDLEKKYSGAAGGKSANERLAEMKAKKNVVLDAVVVATDSTNKTMS